MSRNHLCLLTLFVAVSWQLAIGQEGSTEGGSTEKPTTQNPDYITIVKDGLKFQQYQPVPTQIPPYTGTVGKGVSAKVGWFVVTGWTMTPEVEWVTRPNGQVGANGSPWWKRTIYRSVTKLRSYYRHFQTQKVIYWKLLLYIT